MLPEILALCIRLIAYVIKCGKIVGYWIHMTVDMAMCFVTETMYYIYPAINRLCEKLMENLLGKLLMVVLALWRYNNDISKMLELLTYSLRIGELLYFLLNFNSLITGRQPWG